MCRSCAPVDRVVNRDLSWPAAYAVLAPFFFRCLCHLPLSSISSLPTVFTGHFGTNLDYGVTSVDDKPWDYRVVLVGEELTRYIMHGATAGT